MQDTNGATCCFRRGPGTIVVFRYKLGEKTFEPADTQIVEHVISNTFYETAVQTWFTKI